MIYNNKIYNIDKIIYNKMHYYNTYRFTFQ